MVMQLTIEMSPADTSKMIRPILKTARTYRFDTKPACLVDQVALTTDFKKSEFVADSIRLGAIIVQLAGADALRTLAALNDPLMLEAIRTVWQLTMDNNAQKNNKDRMETEE